MITRFSIENFKSFKSKTSLEIKPITILCGANSTGKSTLMKSLLLLKQTLLSSDPTTAVSLEGPYQFSKRLEDLFYLHGKNSDSIQYEFDIKTTEGISGNIQLTVESGNNETIENFVKEIKVSDSNENYLHIVREQSKYTVKTNRPQLSYHLFSKTDKQIAWSDCSVLFQNFVPMMFQINYENNRSRRVPLILIDIKGKGSNLDRIVSEWQANLQSIAYLGPLRASPQIAYFQFSKSNFELDDSGTNSAQVYWKHENDEIRFNEKVCTLKTAVREAFKLLGMDKSIEVKHSDVMFSFEVGITENDTVPISDVGFGLSQSFPVLLKGLLSKPNRLVMFEQPEIHLHPAWKAKLADLFVAFAKDGRRMIIETHSTELIDKLRLRVIQNPKLKDMINIVFVEQSDLEQTGSVLRPIQLDKLGTPSEWPQGFCDETTKLMEDIVLARAERLNERTTK